MGCVRFADLRLGALLQLDDLLQRRAATDYQGCALDLHQLLPPELAEEAADPLSRGAEGFPNLLVSQGEFDLAGTIVLRRLG